MLQRLVNLVRRLGAEEIEADGPQYGAVPYRVVEGQLVVLLVTSRGRGRWIFPKGARMKGKSPSETAAIEAFEEAGVEGEIEDEPIGSYMLPVTAERPAPVEVQMFPLKVTRQHRTWKEKRQRYRHWAVLAEARRLITHDGLPEIAAKLAERELGDAA